MLGLKCTYLLLMFYTGAVRVYETDDVALTVGNGRSYRTTPRFYDYFFRSYADSHYELNHHHFLVDPEGKTCVTFDRRIGNCLSVTDCYAAFNHFGSDVDDIGTYDPFLGLSFSKRACNYVEPDGRTFYGICCHSKLVNRANIHNNNRNGLTIIKKPSSIDAGDASRIVNGEDSTMGEFPFMVGIENNGQFLCGGSLINANYVLTAAHCVSSLSSFDVAKLIAFMGVVDLADKENRVIRRIRSITHHKNYDAYKLHNDIALMRLAKPVEFSSRIAPICLGGNPNEILDGKDAVAIGWGRLSHGGIQPEILQKVSLQIKSHEDCKNNFGDKAPGRIVNTVICASAPEKDSCEGDSGGPLISGGCLVGIVSWGIGCATDTYGVYTRISSFKSWIAKNKKVE